MLKARALAFGRETAAFVALETGYKLGRYRRRLGGGGVEAGQNGMARAFDVARLSIEKPLLDDKASFRHTFYGGGYCEGLAEIGRRIEIAINVDNDGTNTLGRKLQRSHFGIISGFCKVHHRKVSPVVDVAEDVDVAETYLELHDVAKLDVAFRDLRVGARWYDGFSVAH